MNGRNEDRVGCALLSVNTPDSVKLRTSSEKEWCLMKSLTAALSLLFFFGSVGAQQSPEALKAEILSLKSVS